jgi:outer membrane protein TolC
MQSLLQLQTTQLSVKGSSIQLRYALLENRVSLYLALGSSFDSEPVVPPALLVSRNP